MNENVNDMNSREQIIEQIFLESSQRYSKHVKCRLEHFKRPAAVKKIDYSELLPYVKSMETSMPKDPKHAVKKCDFTQPKFIFRRSGNNIYVLELHFAKSYRCSFLKF